MRIFENVHTALVGSVPAVPPETGGLLGMRNGVVCTFHLDEGEIQTDRYAYVPDISRLNEVIAQWTQSGICFAGMFHSHPYPQFRLSIADEAYIQRMMEAMPDFISELHFPLVFPGMGMTGHVAKRNSGTVTITPEEIIIEKE